MATITPDLVFAQEPANKPDLVFGDTSSKSANARIEVAGRLPALRARLAVGYDNRVARGPGAGTGTAWQIALATVHAVSAAQHQAPSVPTRTSATWQPAQALGTRCATAMHTRLHQPRATRASWAIAHAQCTGSPDTWGDLQRAPMARRTPWQTSVLAGHGREAVWVQLDPRQRPSRANTWQTGQACRAQTAARSGAGQGVASQRRVPWQTGSHPLPGRTPVVPIIPQPDPCYQPAAVLQFKATVAANGDLQFSCERLAPEPRRVPVRKVYIVVNDVSLKRTDSGEPLPCLSLDLSIDADSWTWSWSAQVAYTAYPSLTASAGEPLELEATLNGQRFLLIAEGVPKRERAFGQSTVNLAGRGIAAWLDAPYAPSISHSNAQGATAQQLMAACLATNGAPLGWQLDWQIADWTVPAGLWSHQGSAMAGVLEIAASVGAIVQADACAKTLHILPRYPSAPWRWADATPDLILPPDILTTDSIEPIVQPDYNAIYVSGQSQGVLGHITRSGSAGDLLAPQVTHALMTDAIAARQRGLAEIGNTGRQARIALSMPLSQDTGLLQVGQLVALTEAQEPWRGLVRSVALSAKRDTTLVVRQSIELERHYA